MNYININGKILLQTEGGVPADNGAFRYGYGLFETMLVIDGAIRLLPYHWDRLSGGMACLYLDMHMSVDRLEEQVLRTVEKNNMINLCRVRMQVFAGGGGLYSSYSHKAGYVIECFPLEPETLALNDNGLVAGIATGIAKTPDILSNLKSCSALIYAVAARQAKENKWNDALVCNADNRIIESTIANIFWIKDGTIFTPPLADGCVAGVMRRHILQRKVVKEKSLILDELLQADEVFLTNAIKKIRWVGNIHDVYYTNTVIKTLGDL